MQVIISIRLRLGIACFLSNRLATANRKDRSAIAPHIIQKPINSVNDPEQKCC